MRTYSHGDQDVVRAEQWLATGHHLGQARLWFPAGVAGRPGVPRAVAARTHQTAARRLFTSGIQLEWLAYHYVF